MGEPPEQVQKPVEFTYSWYADFLADLQAADFAFRSYADDYETGDVVLRHDVDLSVESAVTMARLEAAQGIQSTYFVLVSSPLYNPFRACRRKAIAEILALGHDVGLHFSTHEYWNEDEVPDEETLVEQVNQERDVLASVTGTHPSAVSFHRPPSWVLGRRFDAFESAYAPRYFEDATYVADSNQRWRTGPPEVDSFGDTVQVLAHPGLWGTKDARFEERIVDHVDSSCRFVRREVEREFLDGGR